MYQDFEQIMKVGSEKGVVRTPQFPGVLRSGKDTGKMIEFVRGLIKRQKRCRGFQFGVSSGSNDFTIELSGTARTFLGFSILFDDTELFANQPTSTTITINNEIIIQDVQPSFFSPDFMDDEYYFFPRPLSGTDTILLQADGVADIDMLVAVYYI